MNQMDKFLIAYPCNRILFNDLMPLCSIINGGNQHFGFPAIPVLEYKRIAGSFPDRESTITVS